MAKWPCENTCTLSYNHHQIGSMTHLPLFGGRSWNNGMRGMSFYILMIDLPPSCASPAMKLDPNLLNTAPPDVLVPNGAWPSTGTIMNSSVFCFYLFSKVYCQLTISNKVQTWFNSLRPRPNRRHFADDIFKCIFENENEWISPRISLKFVPKVRINNIPALVHIMALGRPGDKPLSETIMFSLRKRRKRRKYGTVN